MSRAVSNNYGTRARRRLQVVALYCGYAVICAGLWFADSAPRLSAQRYGSLVFTLVGFLLFAFGAYTLMRRTFVNSPHIEDSALDERQRALRDHAMRVGYIALSAIVTLQALLFAIASNGSLPVALTPGLANAYFWGVFVVAISLPTALLAWTTPDPVADDE